MLQPEISGLKGIMIGMHSLNLDQLSRSEMEKRYTHSKKTSLFLKFIYKIHVGKNTFYDKHTPSFIHTYLMTHEYTLYSYIHIYTHYISGKNFHKTNLFFSYLKPSELFILI